MPRHAKNIDTIYAQLYQPNGVCNSINYKPSDEDYRFMDIAIDEAKSALAEGNPAIGAVIASGAGRDAQIYPGHSTELTDNNLLAHAEVNSYELARHDLGIDLSQAAAYVTVDPCEMCGRIFTQGRLGKLVIAARKNEVPDFFRQTEWNLDKRLKDAGRTILVVYGVRNKEAKDLMIAENKRHQSGGITA